MDYIKLQEVTDSLAKQTGVTVKAGNGERDWRLREQKVSVHAKDITLSQALDQIAKLLSFCVSREGKDKEWTYTIWRDKKGRDLEAEMLNAEQEAEAQRAKETRQAMLDLAKKALGMSADEAKKLRDKDPTLACLGGTKTGRAFSQLMGSLGQTDLDPMLRGKQVTIPFRSLPPDLQKAAAVTTTGGLEQLMSQNTKDLVPLQIAVSPLKEDVAGELMATGVGGAIAVMGVPKDGPNGADFDPILGAGQPMSIFLFSKPDSRFGKLFAQAIFDAEQGVPKEQTEKTSTMCSITNRA